MVTDLAFATSPLGDAEAPDAPHLAFASTLEAPMTGRTRVLAYRPAAAGPTRAPDQLRAAALFLRGAAHAHDIAAVHDMSLAAAPAFAGEHDFAGRAAILRHQAVDFRAVAGFLDSVAGTDAADAVR